MIKIMKDIPNQFWLIMLGVVIGLVIFGAFYTVMPKVVQLPYETKFVHVTSPSHIDDISEKELNCLAKNVFHESRGEPIEGRLAVAQVTINRVKSPDYPNTICGVVYQYKAFSWTLDENKRKANIKHLEAYKEAFFLAYWFNKGAMWNKDIGTATHFHTKAIKPYWAPGSKIMKVVGNHVIRKMDSHGS